MRGKEREGRGRGISVRTRRKVKKKKRMDGGTCQRAHEPRIGRTGRGVRDLQIVGDRSSSGTTSQISSFFRPLNKKAPFASIFLFAA